MKSLGLAWFFGPGRLDKVQVVRLAVVRAQEKAAARALHAPFHVHVAREAVNVIGALSLAGIRKARRVVPLEIQRRIVSRVLEYACAPRRGSRDWVENRQRWKCPALWDGIAEFVADFELPAGDDPLKTFDQTDVLHLLVSKIMVALEDQETGYQRGLDRLGQ